MIKTVPIDIILNFILGLFMALAWDVKTKEVKSPVFNRYFFGAVLFGLFFFAPIGVYLYYFHTDWSLMYYSPFMGLEPETFKWTGVLAISGYMLSLIIGYQLGQHWIRIGSIGVARLVLGIALAVLVVYTLISLGRLGSVGTFEQWQSGKGVPLFKHHLNYIVTISAIIGGAVMVFMIRAFRLEPSPRA